MRFVPRGRGFPEHAASDGAVPSTSDAVCAFASSSGASLSFKKKKKKNALVVRRVKGGAFSKADGKWQ